MDLNSVVADVLEDYAENIRANKCKLEETEALELVSQIAHVKMNKQDVAKRYNVSEKTIERRELSGIIPPSYNQSITKKIWYLDELIKHENTSMSDELSS